jgi:hypothetical protein
VRMAAVKISVRMVTTTLFFIWVSVGGGNILY